jgi:hypothetical protein
MMSSATQNLVYFRMDELMFEHALTPFADKEFLVCAHGLLGRPE